jgi:hypothetical protein
MSLKVVAATAACLAVALPCAAEDATTPGRLPTGNLRLIGANSSIAQFFVGELPKKAGDTVEVWVYYVQDPALPVDGKPVMQMLQQKRINCASRTAADLYTGGWDGAGRRVIEIPAAASIAIPSGSALESVSNIACETVKAPPMTRVVGNRAAFTLGLQAIRSARQRAGK